MIKLYSSRLCPFAQRTRALLLRLDVPHSIEEIDPEARDAAFLAQTPTGRVPLLVEGKHRLWESRDIADYLVESHGRSDFAPYADDPQLRSRERLFMTTWDSVVVPMFARSLRDSASFDAAERKRLVGHVSELVKTLQWIGLESVDNLLAIHCGPFWARMQWLADRSPLTGVVEEYISVTKWLGLAAATPAVANTLPDRAEAEARLRAMF